jgi:4'-phosphopantetheinyl transferase
MTFTSVALEAPAGITAKLGWDPATSVHDRRRLLAKELVVERLGCDPKEVRVDREAPRGFGYHRRLIATRGGADLPLTIATASFRAATVVAVCEPGIRIGVDLRDLHPDAADLTAMRRHSHLFDESNVPDLVDHWTRAQAVLEADGRGTRVAAQHVRLDTGRTSGWIPDRTARYAIADVSRDAFVITIAHTLA